MKQLSLNSQAIILLTAYFNKNDKPLTITEYSNLATWLLKYNMTPADLLATNNIDILKEYEGSKIIQDRILSLLDRGNAMALSLQKWQNFGIWVITRADEEYPIVLKRKLGQKSPPILYGAGDKKILNTKSIAIVGSRDASIDDLEFAFQLGKKIALCGYSVVSGGARGIDESSMFGSIEADGTTIGIVSDTLAQKVLSKKYREAIQNNNLTLISPYYPDAKFNAGNAMGRNKYIYVLAKSSVVIHSGLKGGTWEGAKENLKNKWTDLFVKKNDDAMAGNSKLLAMGGIELPNLNDIEYLLDYKQKDLTTDETIEEKILKLINGKKMTIDEISKDINEPSKLVKNAIEKLLKSGNIEKHKNRPLRFSKTVKLIGL
ncbi:DNA-processing protein DprA [uncultured Campylobacter sp.]|uniref:DNA-processing protein DprA n=1 Tax=uncultured Campylobacter sp. TaxID=218934 RepID=UPI00261261C8|nr:DNA-processing protein DprA [uncultured Campylobacter sp.]